MAEKEDDIITPIETKPVKKPMFPTMPPNPCEVDQRPTWLKWLDNPLGETVKAVNKVEDKVAQKMAERKHKKNKQDDETVATATAVELEEEEEKKKPLLNAILS